jgi:Zn finger protein HypA/HybF involved in hydrogenase expression
MFLSVFIKLRIIGEYEKMKELKYTPEYIRASIEGFGCIVESEIKTAYEKLTIRCTCGNLWKTDFANFITNKHHVCKKCSSHKGASLRLLEIDYVKEFARERGYFVLDDIYIGYENKMNVVDKDGFQYYSSFHNLLSVGTGVRLGLAKFGRSNPYSLNNAKRWIELNPDIPLKIIGNGFSVTKRELEVKCNICGNEWFTSWDCIYQEVYCPKCKSSTGELAIQKFLDSKNIFYKFQHKFPDCKSKRLLLFDFYFPEIQLCLEWNGRQHYEKEIN